MTKILRRTRKSKSSTNNEIDIVERCLLDKCRVCLKAGKIPIFGAVDISIETAEFGGIEVRVNDKFPQHLCDSCHTLLEGAIQFRKSAQKSQQILTRVGDYLQEDEITVKQEKSTDISHLISKINQNKQCEYLEYADTISNNSDYTDFKNVKIKQEVSSDEKSNCCEYLEYSDSDFSDNYSITGKYVKEEIYDSENEDTILKGHLEKSNKSEKDDDMFMIIVSDKEKSGRNSSRVEKTHNTLEEEFQSHLATDDTPKIHKITCEVCQKIINEKYYKIHLKLHRDTYKDKSRKYASRRLECKICNKVLSYPYYKYHMKMHGNEVEKAERVRKCPLCDKTFSNNYFNDHMKRVHDNQVKKPDVEDCKIRKSKVKVLKCPVCDKKVKEPKYKCHLASHGKPKRKYVCDKCGMTTYHASAFKTHYLTHGSELKYKCQFCPYRGLHLGLLKIHIRTHTGDYNYKCTECPARFLTKSNLCQHQRVHRLPTDFKCDSCSKGFYTKRALERHYSTVHLKDKSHVCEICGKGFGHRDGMLSHQLKVHDRKRLIIKGRLPSYLRPENIKNEE